jgi:hypothetical protein
MNPSEQLPPSYSQNHKTVCDTQFSNQTQRNIPLQSPGRHLSQSTVVPSPRKQPPPRKKVFTYEDKSETSCDEVMMDDTPSNYNIANGRFEAKSLGLKTILSNARAVGNMGDSPPSESRNNKSRMTESVDV